MDLNLVNAIHHVGPRLIVREWRLTIFFLEKDSHQPAIHEPALGIVVHPTCTFFLRFEDLLTVVEEFAPMDAVVVLGQDVLNERDADFVDLLEVVDPGEVDSIDVLFKGRAQEDFICGDASDLRDLHQVAELFCNGIEVSHGGRQVLFFHEKFALDLIAVRGSRLVRFEMVDLLVPHAKAG